MIEKNNTCIYAEVDGLIDHIAEKLGQRWTKSMIKTELRTLDPQIELSVINHIIHLARNRILARYNIDPDLFKGDAIEFYSVIIRNEKNSLVYRMQAQERLDKLLGLESLAHDNPEKYINSVLQALKEMDTSICGEDSPLLPQMDKQKINSVSNVSEDLTSEDVEIISALKNLNNK